MTPYVLESERRLPVVERIRGDMNNTLLAVPALLRIVEALDKYQERRDLAFNTGLGRCASCDQNSHGDGDGPVPCSYCEPLIVAELHALQELREARRELNAVVP